MFFTDVLKGVTHLELAGSNYNKLFLIHKWLCIKVMIKVMIITLWIFEFWFFDLWKTGERTERLRCANSKFLLIFFRLSKYSIELIKQTIIWNATVFFLNLKRWRLEFSNRTHRHGISFLLLQRLKRTFLFTKYSK